MLGCAIVGPSADRDPFHNRETDRIVGSFRPVSNTGSLGSPSTGPFSITDPSTLPKFPARVFGEENRALLTEGSVFLDESLLHEFSISGI